MNSKLFQDYIENCFDRLDASLDAFIKSGDPTDLFKFRVSIKKIRVCMACIEFYHGKKLKEERHILRKYFRKCGKARELRIYQEWLCKHHYTQLMKLIGLDKTCGKKCKELMQDAEKIREETGKIRKELLEFANDIDQRKVWQFFIGLIQTNMPLPLGQPPKTEWHAKRKNLKRVLYARHWQDSKGLKLISKTQALWLDRLQHLLGDWHDNEVMIAWMREQGKKKGTNSLRYRLRKAIVDMENRSRAVARKVESQLKNSSTILQSLQNRMIFFVHKKSLQGRPKELLIDT